ncbi:MAG: sigma-54 dependent transcriptional regulator [Bacteroidota bacterium]
MILIIDDNQAVLASLKLLLKNEGWDCAAVKKPHTALEFVREQKPELVLLDMNFSLETTGEEGLDLLQQILAIDPSLAVILITGWATIELAIKGMRAGARDFISKPWDNDQLVQSIKTALALTAFQAQTTTRKELDQQYNFGHIVGEDPAFMKILQTVGRVANTDASILILGESGTGKELIAEAIHQNSRRAEEAFVKVNLGGISTTLFESELFGHKKGAYTDARYDRKGRFELANKGTIFLDEIGELELSSQVKLLRVLQDRSFEVLGSSESKRVDVRIISATNKDVAEMVPEGLFREDLYYRINLISIRLPSLRERSSDIPLLVDFYIRNLQQIYQRPALNVSKKALKWLTQYEFPGNIRQLKNLVERTVLMSSSDTLEAEDFQSQLGTPVRRKSDDALPEVGSMSLDEIEKQMILKAMAHHSGKVGKVAEALGLSRNALYRRLEKYGIQNEA